MDSIDLRLVEGKRVPDWALDSTLQELVDLVQTQVQYQQKDGARDKLAQAQKRKTDKKEDVQFKKQYGMTTQVVSAIGGLSGLTSRLIKASIVGGASLETVILRSAQRVVDKLVDIESSSGSIFGKVGFGLLGTAVGLAIGSVNLLVDRISESFTAFKTLTETGYTFGGQLGNLYIEAGKSAMSLSEYTRILDENAQSIKALTTSYERGEQVFGRMSKNVRNTIYSNTQMVMGISEINDYLGDYLETQRVLGALQNFNETKQQMRVVEYLDTLTDLTKITGKRRDQIHQEVQQYQQKTDVTALLMTLPEETQNALQKVFSAFSAMGLPEEANNVVTYMSGLGTVFNKSQGILRTLVPEFASISQELVETAKNGKLNDAVLLGFAKRLSDAAKQIDLSTIRQLTAGQEVVGLEVIEMINKLRVVNFEELKRKQEENDAIINLMNAWEQLTRELIGPFNQLMGKVINMLADFLGQEETLKTFKRAIEQITTKFDTLLSDKKLEEALKSLTENVVALATVFIELLNDDTREKAVEKITDAVGDFIGWVLRAAWDAIVPDFDDIFQLQKGKTDEELGRTPENRGEGYGLYGRTNARGGIATMPSIFGEAGPEVAIPLTTGKKIPVAEISGGMNTKELREISNSMTKFLEKQNVILEQNERLIKKMDRVNTSIGRTSDRLL